VKLEDVSDGYGHRIGSDTPFAFAPDRDESVMENSDVSTLPFRLFTLQKIDLPPHRTNRDVPQPEQQAHSKNSPATLPSRKKSPFRTSTKSRSTPSAFLVVF
jgi:hypothetical protein